MARLDGSSTVLSSPLPGSLMRRLTCGLQVLGLLALGACHRQAVIEESVEPDEPVRVRSAVDRAVATTGDLITYRIEVDAAADYEVEIPEAGADIAGFRIVDVGQTEPVEKSGRLVRERWYELRADLVGSYILPPVEVAFRAVPPTGEEPGPWQTISTSELFVEVESVLPSDGEATDIRGLKPLREVRPGLDWRLLVAILVAGLALAGLAVWLVKRRAGRGDTAPPIPAHELAFAALGRLRQTDFENPRAVRRFYFQISEVLRAYVEGRFELNATDLTTEEIVTGLASLQEMAADQNRVLKEFLVATDQVKFAHREPTKTDIEETYEQALGFVEATRPMAEPLPEEQAA